MTDTAEKIKAIGLKITWIAANLEAENSQGRTDVNLACEDFFCQILNVINDSQLKNLNKERKNYPGIDLGDSDSKVAYQVTSEVERKGIQKKVNAIAKNKVYELFTDIRFLILKKKKKYKGSFKGNEEYSLDTAKIISIHEILDQIKKLNKGKIDLIYEFVNVELPSIQPPRESPTLPNPVKDEYLKDLDYSTVLRDKYNSITALEYLEQLEKSKWDKADNVFKYKILATKGLCYLELHKESEAAKLFIQAYQFNNVSEKATSLRALGHALLEQKNEACVFVAKTLKKNPLNEDAYSVKILLEKNNLNFEDVLTLIPEPLRSNSQVAYSLAFYARSINDFQRAIYWYEQSLTSSTIRKGDIKGSLGSTIIESTINPFDFVTNQYDLGKLANVQRGIKLLDEAWEEVKHSDLKFTRIWWLINRAIGKKILRKSEEAVLDLYEASTIVPTNPDVLRHYGIGLFEVTKYNEALEVFKKCKTLSQEDPTLDLLIAEAKFQCRMFDEVILDLKKLKTNPVLDNQTISECNAVLINTYLQKSLNAEAIALCKEVLNSSKPSIRFILLLSRIHQDLGNNNEADSLIEQAKVSVNQDASLEDIHDLAKTLFAKKEFVQSIELLEKIVNTKVYSKLSEILIHAYVYSGEYQKALVLCSDLKSNFGEKDFLIEIEAYIHTETHDYKKAIDLCESFLAKFSDSQLITYRLCHIYYLTKEYSKLKELLTKLKHVENQNYHLRFRIARYHVLVGNYLLALEAAYQARRDNFSIGETHKLYFQIYNLVPREFTESELVNIKNVKVNCQVTLHHEDSKSDISYLLVDYGEAKLYPTEIKIGDTLSQKLLGKSIEEVVYLNGQSYKIVAISDKYFLSIQESIHLLSTIHAGTSGFESMKLPEQKTGDVKRDLKPLFDLVDKSEESEKIVNQAYLSSQITIGSIAKLKNINPIRVFIHLIRESEYGIFSIGEPNELINNSKKLGKLLTNIIVDLTTLLFFFVNNKLNLLNSGQEKLFVSQATLDEIIALIHEFELHKIQGEFVTISKHKGQYVKENVRISDLEKAIEDYTKLKNWVVDNTKILPTPPSLSINYKKKKEVEGMIGHCFIDTILISQDKDLVLMSDDARLRVFAHSEYGVSGISSYTFICLLLSSGKINEGEFHELACDMISLNYRSIPVSEKLLSLAAEKSSFNLTPPFSTALESLSSEVSDQGSSIIVAVAFLKALYLRLPLTIERERISGKIVSILCAGRNKHIVLKSLKARINYDFNFLPFEKKHLLESIEVWEQFSSL
jgi:Tfp pilus assembly protein PilF